MGKYSAHNEGGVFVRDVYLNPAVVGASVPNHSRWGFVFRPIVVTCNEGVMRALPFFYNGSGSGFDMVGEHSYRFIKAISRTLRDEAIKTGRWLKEEVVAGIEAINT